MRNYDNDFRNQMYEEDEVIRFLRGKAVRSNTGERVKEALIRLYIYITGVPLWKKIRDVAVGLGVSYAIVSLILSIASGDETFHTFFPNFTPIRGTFTTMLSFYPVLVFWLHKTSIMSDEDYQFEEALKWGKSRYKYREDKLRFKGYGLMLLFLLIWAVFIDILFRKLPAILCYPIISLPLFIQFLPEEISLYKFIKNLIKNKEINA